MQGDRSGLRPLRNYEPVQAGPWSRLWALPHGADQRVAHLLDAGLLEELALYCFEGRLSSLDAPADGDVETNLLVEHEQDATILSARVRRDGELALQTRGGQDQ
jgi:hypothetical protein